MNPKNLRLIDNGVLIYTTDFLLMDVYYICIVDTTIDYIDFVIGDRIRLRDNVFIEHFYLNLNGKRHMLNKREVHRYSMKEFFEPEVQI